MKAVSRGRSCREQNVAELRRGQAAREGKTAGAEEKRGRGAVEGRGEGTGGEGQGEGRGRGGEGAVGKPVSEGTLQGLEFSQPEDQEQ